MTKTQVEVITSDGEVGRDRRRSGSLPRPWSPAQSLRSWPGRLGSMSASYFVGASNSAKLGSRPHPSARAGEAGNGRVGESRPMPRVRFAPARARAGKARRPSWRDARRFDHSSMKPIRQLSVTSATQRGLPSALLAGASFPDGKGPQADWRPRPRRLHLPLA